MQRLGQDVVVEAFTLLDPLPHLFIGIEPVSIIVLRVGETGQKRYHRLP